jgi:5'(3')-deoxyribonucleotidase
MTREDFVEYDIRKVWRGGPVEAEQVFKKYIKYSSIDIAPLKGAQKVLHTLSGSYDIVVMTSRDMSNFPKTNEWITHHFPEIFKDVHLLGNAQDSIEFQHKAKVCKDIGVYCLIDDHLSHVLEANELGMKTLLFGDYPWNQMDKLPKGMKRAKDWGEVLEYFDGETKQRV